MLLVRMLQSQGFGSRKACRDMIENGQLAIAGVVHNDPDEDVEVKGLDYTLDGEAFRYREQVYVALNKPPGYECSAKPSHHPGVLSLLPAELSVRGIQSAGRLDHDTTGLLLLTDDGQFIHKVTSPKHVVEKEYDVTTADPVTEEQLASFQAGVEIEDDGLVQGKCTRLADNRFRMIVTEGKYHQVKRMVGAIGNRVTGLHRVRIGQLALPETLEPGGWMFLEEPDRARVLS